MTTISPRRLRIRTRKVVRGFAVVGAHLTIAFAFMFVVRVYLIVAAAIGNTPVFGH